MIAARAFETRAQLAYLLALIRPEAGVSQRTAHRADTPSPGTASISGKAVNRGTDCRRIVVAMGAMMR